MADGRGARGGAFAGIPRGGLDRLELGTRLLGALDREADGALPHGHASAPLERSFPQWPSGRPNIRQKGNWRALPAACRYLPAACRKGRPQGVWIYQKKSMCASCYLCARRAASSSRKHLACTPHRHAEVDRCPAAAPQDDSLPAALIAARRPRRLLEPESDLVPTMKGLNSLPSQRGRSRLEPPHVARRILHGQRPDRCFGSGGSHPRGGSGTADHCTADALEPGRLIYSAVVEPTGA